MKTLDTTRLYLRSFQIEDVHDVYAYAKLDSVGPNAGWKPHESESETKEIIAKFIENDDVFAIVLKDQNKVIGSVGVHPVAPGIISLGYVLSTDYEGRGLMSEACQRVLAYVFMETDIQEIQVSHFLGNHKSERVIQKCGFIWLGEKQETDQTACSRRSIHYRLTIKDYLAQRRENDAN
ncbi:MAG: GNAT family N-acetyltransferase [Candidatus Izemoplasmatales bacterium]